MVMAEENRDLASQIIGPESTCLSLPVCSKLQEPVGRCMNWV
jgi:hypothetical protein